MKVLFTKKKLDKKLIAEELNSEVTVDFIDVIVTKTIKKTAFDLKGKSLIFTSVKAVEAFFENNFEPTENLTSKKFNKIYCVGESTKKRLRKYGFGTYKVKKNAKKLAKFIIDKAEHERFIHFGGNLTLDTLQKKLTKHGIPCQSEVLYETLLLFPEYKNEYDAVVFFSPSGVKSFGRNNDFAEKYAFSIGSTTTKTLEDFLCKEIFTSKENNLKDILLLINKAVKSTQDK